MTSSELVLSVSDFVAVFNQTLEYAYPTVTVVGELANFRVSKNRWVYFDLKDESASVKFFGTVYQLPGPLEDGLMVQVSGVPRLHPLYGFSITVQNMQPVGEGSLKRAAALLEAKLRAEGLFDDSRKRPLPYPPQRMGLVTSRESAAYHDFIKIINERWGGVEIELADVQVQGVSAPSQIVAAIEHFSTHDEPVDVVVVTRGGGSAEDLAAFSTESVTRAIAGSRIPTIVAIGHEIDLSLAELAADQRASTPSNAAQLLVPDKRHIQQQLATSQRQLGEALVRSVTNSKTQLYTTVSELTELMQRLLEGRSRDLMLQQQILAALNPDTVLKRGYAIVRQDGKAVVSTKAVSSGDTIDISMQDGDIRARVM